MTFSPRARDLLKHLEGCRLEAYRDQAGVWTVGVGHTGQDVRPDTKWSPSQADAALDQDLQRFVSGVGAEVAGLPLSDNEFSALVIFAFNVGLTAFRGSTALRLVKQGRFHEVPAALALWNKITDASGVHVVNAGLVKRRAAEAALWSTPSIKFFLDIEHGAARCWRVAAAGLAASGFAWAMQLTETPRLAVAVKVLTIFALLWTAAHDGKSTEP